MGFARAQRQPSADIRCADTNDVPTHFDEPRPGAALPTEANISGLAGALQASKTYDRFSDNVESQLDAAASPLEAAILSGNLDAVRALFQPQRDLVRVRPQIIDAALDQGYWSIVDFLTDSGCDAIAELRPDLAAMTAQILAAPEIYRPSSYWQHFNELHLRQLSLGGMRRFKRSINQYYFNFVPHSPFDPKLMTLLKHWLARPTGSPWHARMMDPDISPEDGSRLPVNRSVFTVMSQRGPHIGRIARRVQMLLYRAMVCMLWEFTRNNDRMGLLDQLEEPALGAPIQIFDGSRLISQDLAHSVLECNAVFEGEPPFPPGRPLRIAEVGAGYGRLGHVLLACIPCTYFVFDIPPGLGVSQWYLSRLFPEKKIFRFRTFDRIEDVMEEIAAADVAFFTPDQIERFPERFFDVSINISSLHEMRTDQIDNLLRQIYRVSDRKVYLKQYKRAVNPHDRIIITEDCYRIDSGWKARYHRTTAVDSRFFETLIERLPQPADGPTQAEVPVPLMRRSRERATVSILMPNYNHAAFLRTALAGACEQSRPADEILVLDDGSTDHSLDIIEEFRAQHRQLRVLRNETNRGLQYSINRLLDEARGEFIVSAAADDELLPTFLDKSLAALERTPGAVICFSELVVKQSDGATVNWARMRPISYGFGSLPEYAWPKLLHDRLKDRYLVLSSNTVVADRQVLRAAGGFIPALEWHADWFAFYSMALRYGACLVPEGLAVLRANPGGYSDTGIHDARRQRQVLFSLIGLLREPRNRDLLELCRRYPSIFTVFNFEVLPALAPRPADWDLLTPYFKWGINYYRRNRGLSWPGLCRHVVAMAVEKTRGA